jgi:hypothetical protein
VASELRVVLESIDWPDLGEQLATVIAPQPGRSSSVGASSAVRRS